jgi:hypothetical protein
MRWIAASSKRIHADRMRARREAFVDSLTATSHATNGSKDSQQALESYFYTLLTDDEQHALDEEEKAQMEQEAKARVAFLMGQFEAGVKSVSMSVGGIEDQQDALNRYVPKDNT